MLIVIDEEGKHLGEMKRQDAIRLAGERGLDLVEVSPNAKPPVAKVLEWSKFKYELSKKRKDSKGKTAELKEMWFQNFIGEGDLKHKMKKVIDFLKKRHQVKLTVRPARRKRYNRDAMRKLMDKILKELGDSVKSEDNPKFEGRNYVIIVTPVSK